MTWPWSPRLAGSEISSSSVRTSATQLFHWPIKASVGCLVVSKKARARCGAGQRRPRRL